MLMLIFMGAMIGRLHDLRLAEQKEIIRRIQSEKKLKESEERYRSTVESMKDFVFTLDSDGCFTGYHAPDDSMLYAPPEEFLKKNFKDILPPHVVKLLSEALDKVGSGELSAEFDYPMEIDGQKHRFNAILTAQHDSTGSFNGATAVVRDITEREKRLHELEKWEKVTVDREMKMIELKKKIKTLERRLRKAEERSNS